MNEKVSRIINNSIDSAKPDVAVKKTLSEIDFGGRKLHIIAIGKAAWQMAYAACKCDIPVEDGIIITKYGHSPGPIDKMTILEAGHPVPDENSYEATAKAVSFCNGLGKEDAVLFLVSGGGSSLFELPMISGEEYSEITSQLLKCGADIAEINTVRKHLSKVKGGRFAQICHPAKIYSIILSDVLGDRIDAIASGPSVPDSTTAADAMKIINRYSINLSEKALNCISSETPKTLDNVINRITGSVKILCETAEKECRRLGYKTIILTDCLNCSARDAGLFLGSIAKTYASQNEKIAFICGGETTVKVVGTGMGGRNQELVLAAAKEITGLENVILFSVGSDGTDGPTDAAGAWVDSSSAGKLAARGISIDDALADNDAYHALKAIDSLVFTGPTGTNVNDLTVLLIN